jgi:hypothetical protein
MGGWVGVGGTLGASPSFKEFGMKKYEGLLAALVLLFAGCSNPVDGLLSYNDIYDIEEEEYIDQNGALAEITFSETQLVANTDTASSGAVITKVTFPETGGPWWARLVDGPGSTHNGNVTAVHYDEDDNEVNNEEESPVPAYATIAINSGVTLEVGAYSLRTQISNNNGTTLVKIFSFRVTLTPPAFSDPPSIYPKVESGANKLDIRWPKRAKAVSYTVYVGTTDVFGAATTKVLGTYPQSNEANTDYKGWTESAVMANFPDESDPLPDNTAYWVWVTASSTGGTTPPSPVAMRKTSLPIQSYFYDQYYHAGDSKYGADAQTGRPWFHGSGDNYYFTNTTSTVDAGTLGTIEGSGTIEYKMGIGGYDYIGDAVYHETWYQGENGVGSEGEDNGPFPDTSKSGADCLGLPAGVFVIKYQEDHVPPALTGHDNTPGKMKRYGAVYYWGMGAIRSSGRMESNIVNQWNGYAETVTMEEALDRFTAAKVATFLGLIPESYYKDFE